MNKWAKYEFTTEEQANDKIDSLSVSYTAIVKLGNIVLQDATETEDAVLSDKYHLDVLWKDIEDHPYGWKSYAVTNVTENGIHSFLGMDYQTNKF